jgi:hypothetical protein
LAGNTASLSCRHHLNCSPGEDDIGVVCWMPVPSPERIIAADRASYQR